MNKLSTYGGIDYSLGQSNRDENGIAYGVISQGSIEPENYNYFDLNYPLCDDCDECDGCEIHKAGDYCDAEPIGQEYTDKDYNIIDCLDNDLMVLKSPFFTWAQFCSPCVPGAGNLDTPTKKGIGVKCYCLGADWFDGQKAPYPVYSVETGKLVK